MTILFGLRQASDHPATEPLAAHTRAHGDGASLSRTWESCDRRPGSDSVGSSNPQAGAKA